MPIPKSLFFLCQSLRNVKNDSKGKSELSSKQKRKWKYDHLKGQVKNSLTISTTLKRKWIYDHLKGQPDPVNITLCDGSETLQMF